MKIAHTKAPFLKATYLLVVFFCVAVSPLRGAISDAALVSTKDAIFDSWRPEDPIPQELRHFHQSPGDLPDPADTYSLISRVANPQLLAALAVDLGAGLECREDALSQGLELLGPNRFFELLRAKLPTEPAPDSEPWVREVRERMSRRHAVVDALFISYDDMPQQQATAVIARITADLNRHVPWARVYSKFSREFGYKNGTRTKIGNLGHLVVFADPALGSGHYVKVQPGVEQYEGIPLPRRLWRLSYFDSTHLPALLKAGVGDVISMPSDVYREFVVYQVQEVYAGVADSGPH
jgi:hypothetical protein